MSNLPSNDQSSDNYSQASTSTDHTQNQAHDQIEQKIDAQITQSIGEQQELESQGNSHSIEESIQINNNGLLNEEQEPVPEEPNEHEYEEGEEGPMVRIFDHRNINILRVLNELMAEDPVDFSDEEDSGEDDDDPGK